uniref:Uncharacterized protein n=1 Tax=Rangifer tarandus platyrhynchus TaxID=3082113 RepID=A0ACB0ETX0_RANTA|nr:unnamed protein product [Rangifer tarandus platyrhynchus]
MPPSRQESVTRRGGAFPEVTGRQAPFPSTRSCRLGRTQKVPLVPTRFPARHLSLGEPIFSSLDSGASPSRPSECSQTPAVPASPGAPPLRPPARFPHTLRQVPQVRPRSLARRLPARQSPQRAAGCACALATNR